jgi:hopanoid biosynthesis associated protein HpnK
MKKLIVNADDLGLTDGISNGIIAAHKHGIVTSASIMANEKGFEYAVGLARANPELSVGIHLALVSGKPVSHPSKIPTLVDSAGTFPNYYPVFLKRLISRKINLADVERELRAQIEKCLAANLALSHLDSHQHIHILPPIFRILVRLATEYKIPGIRLPNEPVQTSPAKNFFQYLQSRALLTMAVLDRRQLRKKELVSSDFTGGIMSSGKLDEKELAEILRRLPDGVTEMVCHPGEEDKVYLPGYGWWTANWKAELSALTSRHIKCLVRDLNIELTNYTKLQRSSVVCN